MLQYIVFLGLTGFHHYLHGDDRLAFLFATSWGIYGLGWIFDVFTFWISHDGRLFSWIRSLYTLMYMKFLYIKFEENALKYVLDFHPMFFCVSVIVLPLYIAGYIRFTTTLFYITSLFAIAEAELERTKDFNASNYILFSWFVVITVNYFRSIQPSTHKTLFHSYIPYMCMMSLFFLVAFIFYKKNE